MFFIYRTRKLFKKIILILVFFQLITHLDANSFKIHPSLKSALIPGLGEYSLSKTTQSKLFNLVELTLWSTFLGFNNFSSHKRLQYKSYAAKYAGINLENKNHQYWVDIGNYLNLKDHNDEHLRWRQMKEIYNEEFNWSWKSRSHMEKFEKMRINSDKLAKYGQYTLGLITLNHIVSSINSLYLSRLNDDLKIYSFSKEKNIKVYFLYNF